MARVLSLAIKEKDVDVITDLLFRMYSQTGRSIYREIGESIVEQSAADDLWEDIDD